MTVLKLLYKLLVISPKREKPSVQYKNPVSLTVVDFTATCSRQRGTAEQAQLVIMFTGHIKILCVFLFCLFICSVGSG